MLKIKDITPDTGTMEIADVERHFSILYFPQEIWCILSVGGSGTCITTASLLDILDWAYDSTDEPRLVIHDDDTDYDIIFRRLPSEVKGEFGVIASSHAVHCTHLDNVFVLSDDDVKVLREFLVEAIHRATEWGKKRSGVKTAQKEASAPQSLFDI